MNVRIPWLTIVCLMLAAIPAWADYDNGPINGTTDAWTINFGYIVSDSYVAASSANFTGFQFGVWEFPGDTMISVQWSVTSAENGGTLYGSGIASGPSLTDEFISTNQFGYNIDLITVTGLIVPQQGGTTYWLNLQNAAVPSGDPVFWDENSGAGCKGQGCPSQASESAVGTIASEAFTLNGCGAGKNNLPDCGPPTPEPSSILLFGSGILGLAGVFRRKLNL